MNHIEIRDIDTKAILASTPINTEMLPQYKRQRALELIEANNLNPKDCYVVEMDSITQTANNKYQV